MSKKMMPLQPTSQMLNASVNAWQLWNSRDNGGSVQELGALIWQHMSEAAPFEINHQEYAKDLLDTIQDVATAVGYTGQDPEELTRRIKHLKEWSDKLTSPKPEKIIPKVSVKKGNKSLSAVQAGMLQECANSQHGAATGAIYGVTTKQSLIDKGFLTYTPNPAVDSTQFFHITPKGRETLEKVTTKE